MGYILVLLVIGLFFWIFISSNRGQFTTQTKPLSFETVLYSEFGYIMALIAKLAKSDGHVSELEAELIENILDDLCDEFHDPKTARLHLKLIFAEEKEVQDNITFVATELYKIISDESYKLHKILEFLVNLAFIDGELHTKERAVILEIADAFYIDRASVESIFAQFDTFYGDYQEHHQAMDETQMYKLLGVDPACSDDELKKAYKRGVKSHHPDVVMGKGGTQEDIKVATQKLQEINEAYEAIKKRRGL